jgi:predicted nucleic acid-binding Zn ribbon protein
MDPDDDLDRELPDPSDMSSGDEPGLDACPYCRRMISEEAVRCHHCGKYLSQEDHPRGQSILITLLIVLLVVAAIMGWLLSS